VWVENSEGVKRACVLYVAPAQIAERFFANLVWAF